MLRSHPQEQLEQVKVVFFSGGVAKVHKVEVQELGGRSDGLLEGLDGVFEDAAKSKAVLIGVVDGLVEGQFVDELRECGNVDGFTVVD